MAVAIGRETGTFPIAELVAALRRAMLAARYVASPDGRDARLDLLRGFCVFAMVVDHIGGVSWLYVLTGGNVGPISAAEGFVFLSGLVLGLVYRRKIERAGLRAAVASVLWRAGTLYLLTVVLTLIFGALTALTSLSLWVDRALWPAEGAWAELAVATLLLRFTWNGTDILALYALLLAGTPVVLALLARGLAAWVLIGSLGLWLGHQLAPSQVVLPWTIQNAQSFPVAAWQVLFVGAVVVGYHRREIEAWALREAARPSRARLRLRAILGTAAGAALLLGWAWSTDRALAFVPDAFLALSLDLFDKPSLGIGRLLLFAATAVLAVAATTLAWRPLHAAVGWLLIPLGQTSLYGYTVHLFLILAAYNVPPYVGRSQPGLELYNTLGQLVMVLVLWGLVKRQILFGLIPR